MAILDVLLNLKRFLRHNRGNLATTVATLALPLVGSAAFAVDYTVLNHQKAKLQEVADGAALASVKELGLSGSDEDILKKSTVAFVRALLTDDDRLSAGHARMKIDVDASRREGEVTVSLAYEWKPFMAHLISSRVTPIEAKSTAVLAGNALTCVIGLMEPQSFAKASIHLDHKAVIKADNCSVYSNSHDPYGLRADENAKLTAAMICSAGGVMSGSWMGKAANFQPQPLTDCPKIPDPLSSRQMPKIGSCDHKNLVVGGKATALSPGTYCGGLAVENAADIKLNPGVYVIKDGPLVVGGKSSLKGEGVTFVLTGPDSVFDFQKDTTIDLSAPDKGVTAGLLFFEDRSVPHSFEFNPFYMQKMPPEVRLHRISSNDARNLLGTIYLSKSIVLINADAPVADASAYTAIIAGRLWLQEGPTLTLNANLTDTTVPVPDGLVGSKPRLKK